jgi:two-component system, sensor histidine kinase LadS
MPADESNHRRPACDVSMGNQPTQMPSEAVSGPVRGVPWRRLVLLALAVLLIMPMSALAGLGDRIVERVWLDDPGRQLGWPAVMAAEGWQPYSHLLSRGYGSSAIWIRIRINPAVSTPLPGQPVPRQARLLSGDPNRLVLQIRPVYLDDIRIYLPGNDDGPVAAVGDHHHPADSVLSGLNYYHILEGMTEPLDVYLRLTSTSTRQIHIEALDLFDLASTETRQQLLFNIYLVLMAMLTVWGATHWLLGRDALMGMFALQQSSATLYALAALGVLKTLWPISLPALVLDQYVSVMSVVAVATGIFFHVRLLDEVGVPRWCRRFNQALLLWQGVKVLLLAGNQTTLALHANMLDVTFVPIYLLFVVVLGCLARRQPPRRSVLPDWLVIGFYAILVLTLLGAGLTGLGIAAGPELALYIVQVHGLLVGALIMGLLQYRAYRQRGVEAALRQELATARLTAGHERRMRAEQDVLLDMLAHELRNPLALMRMHIDGNDPGNATTLAAIADMSAVIDRCMQTNRLGTPLQLVLSELDLTALVWSTASSCAVADRLHVEVDPALPRLISDRQLLVVILSNLLDNARKYSPPWSPIEASLTAADSGLRLTLRNPIKPGTLPEPSRVFEKYYRAQGARSQSGAGLGLYLSAFLVTRLGGSIDCSSIGDHAEMTVNLPWSVVEGQAGRQ